MQKHLRIFFKNQITKFVCFVEGFSWISVYFFFLLILHIQIPITVNEICEEKCETQIRRNGENRFPISVLNFTSKLEWSHKIGNSLKKYVGSGFVFHAIEERCRVVEVFGVKYSNFEMLRCHFKTTSKIIR